MSAARGQRSVPLKTGRGKRDVRQPPAIPARLYSVNHRRSAAIPALSLVAFLAACGGGGQSVATDTCDPLCAGQSTGSAAAAQATPSPSPSPTQFTPQTLLNVSGSGNYTTAKFTVGGNGDYDVDWTYNEGSMGGSVNFDFTADGGNDSQLTGPNQLGTGGSGVTHVYSDAGTHYLQVSGEGGWTVKVVTAP